jgi:hypothetical protein
MRLGILPLVVLEQALDGGKEGLGHGFCCFNLRLDGATRGKAEYHLMGRLESGMWIFEAPR